LDWLARILVSRLVHALIVHTKSAKQQAISTCHLRDRQKIFIVPHGNYIDCYENKIDRTSAREKLGIPDSKLVMLFLGGVRPYKGVLELVESFKLLKDKRAELLIAGKPLNSKLSSIIATEIRGCNNIRYVPSFIPEDEIQVYMNACDVVVFPYRHILSSGAVILAMSFGRPCIAPRTACMTDVLNDAGAFLYEPTEKGGLLWAMKCAIERKDNLRSMGKHNKKLAEQWDWNNVAEMTLEVYQRCLYRNSEIVPATDRSHIAN
jgi:glycosyltransferase involved in cell wall biosynthesis